MIHWRTAMRQLAVTSQERRPSFSVLCSLAEGGTRVLVQEVPQRRNEVPSTRNIALPNGCTHVVHQHVPDLLASALTLEQVTAEHNRRGLGNVLVLGNGLDLVWREIAEADQICK
jgi:hypothetical protein